MASEKDGTIFPVEITGRFSTGRKRAFIIAAIRDITERWQAEKKILEQQKLLEETNARLEELAVKDPLTGLFNRRAFDERLKAEIAHTCRHKTPLSLALVDIDFFKFYNDTYGHPAGDEILIKLAQILEDHSRGADVACRYGGEEFILILPGTDVEGAICFAERCRKSIENAEWPRRAITASFGMATFEGTSSGFDGNIEIELVTKADRALYHSKNTGRNRVSHFDKQSHL
ncbi:MAG: diguanylate cyclase [Anaerolineae bacterium]|nr:diguanylate cyclase [Anaerolineae bacterium]